ncbi:hypothetical protein Aduo_006765 [Ancylostoma duodenale]
MQQHQQFIALALSLAVAFADEQPAADYPVLQNTTFHQYPQNNCACAPAPVCNCVPATQPTCQCTATPPSNCGCAVQAQADQCAPVCQTSCMNSCQHPQQCPETCSNTCKTACQPITQNACYSQCLMSCPPKILPACDAACQNNCITDDEYSRKLIHMMSYNTPGMLPTTTPAPPVTLPPVTLPPMQSQCNQCQSTCGQTCQQQIPVAAPVCQQQCQQICQPVCNPAPVTQPPPEIKVTVQESAVKGMNCQPNCESACNQQCVQLSQDKAVPTTPSFKRTFYADPGTIYDCRNISCVCTFLEGTFKSNKCMLTNGKLFSKALRKEYRTLSDNERNRFHAAMWTIKRSGVFDDLVRIHSRFASSSGAHSGPAFLPWHREYLKRVELALRFVDPSVAIPYWDSALDSHLPSPKDSVFWSEELFGGATPGEVKDGAFKGWMLENGTRVIRRNVGHQAAPMLENHVEAAINTSSVEGILAYTASGKGCPVSKSWNALEYTHGNPHIFVGEDMVLTSSSANDPVFFLHHSFIDLIWETWRLRKQTRNSRELDYPQNNTHCSSVAHFSSALMRPFDPLLNKDGLSNDYTDFFYSYTPRVTCSLTNHDCGSKYLFCDVSHGKPMCASKAAVGGNCTGFEKGEECCYKSVCRDAKCVLIAESTTIPANTSVLNKPTVVNITKTSTTTTKLLRLTTSTVPAGEEQCFNENECCGIWAESGHCEGNPSFMLSWCKASCDVCAPNYNITLECTDRYSSCSDLAHDCNSRGAWMKENCRKSCGFCNKTREQDCTASSTISPVTTTTSASSTERDAPSKIPSSFHSACMDFHFCCSVWAGQNLCTNDRFMPYMEQTCAASCDRCGESEFSALWNAAGCFDFHTLCEVWASSNLCESRKQFMWENCKRSCRMCVLANSNNRAAACRFERPTSQEESPQSLNAGRLFLQQFYRSIEKQLSSVCTNY